MTKRYGIYASNGVLIAGWFSSLDTAEARLRKLWDDGIEGCYIDRVSRHH